MSIVDHCTIQAGKEEITRSAGHSLASSLYRRNTVVWLTGPLGAGKTTFVQGFAKGLGITDRITSPTYALEQRYGDVLLHMDLYRIGSKQHIDDILRHSEDFPGIRIIEWADRIPAGLHKHDIRIAISEGSSDHSRTIGIAFHDIDIPSLEQIQEWRREVLLPLHIVRHTEAVASACEKLSFLLQRDGAVIRHKAAIAAAHVHDLLRFVDFKGGKAAPAGFRNTKEEMKKWQALRTEFGSTHEHATTNFLRDRGYPDIGTITLTHKGRSPDVPITTEQRLLAYADKRVIEDRVVTLSDRFENLGARYRDGKETPESRAWYQEVRNIERTLFPNGEPAL